jgi:hypothetical protein
VILQNGVTIDCSAVDCGNVCRMACNRNTTSSDSACTNTCGEITSTGSVYVFRRPGCCYNSLAAPFVPTYVGFGIQVAPNVFLFRSVENGVGLPQVFAPKDNSI